MTGNNILRYYQSQKEGTFMNMKLSLLTMLTVICNVAEAGTIHNTLMKEHAITKASMEVIKKHGGDIKPYIMKEIALVSIYNCMSNKRMKDQPTLDEMETFCKCFEMASFMKKYMGNERDNDLYANALEEIQTLVTTKQMPVQPDSASSSH
jgi:hypothetical protein